MGSLRRFLLGFINVEWVETIRRGWLWFRIRTVSAIAIRFLGGEDDDEHDGHDSQKTDTTADHDLLLLASASAGRAIVVRLGVRQLLVIGTTLPRGAFRLILVYCFLHN